MTRQIAERREYTHEGGWTDERVAMLTKLWGEGLSCSQIAKAMGEGLTRNSVIGKVHRLKLPRRLYPSKPRKPRTPRPRIDRMVRAKLRFKSTPKPRQVEPDIAPEQFEFSASAWQPLPGSIPVTMEFMTGCKWPVGNPYGTDMALFCNCVPMEGKPYCREHAERSRGKGTVMEQKAVKEAQTTARREAVCAGGVRGMSAQWPTLADVSLDLTAAAFVVACRDCNLSKGDKTILEWVEYLRGRS